MHFIYSDFKNGINLWDFSRNDLQTFDVDYQQCSYQDSIDGNEAPLKTVLMYSIITGVRSRMNLRKVDQNRLLCQKILKLYVNVEGTVDISMASIHKFYMEHLTEKILFNLTKRHVLISFSKKYNRRDESMIYVSQPESSSRLCGSSKKSKGAKNPMRRQTIKYYYRCAN